MYLLHQKWAQLNLSLVIKALKKTYLNIPLATDFWKNQLMKYPLQILTLDKK